MRRILATRVLGRGLVCPGIRASEEAATFLDQPPAFGKLLPQHMIASQDHQVRPVHVGGFEIGSHVGDNAWCRPRVLYAPDTAARKERRRLR